MTVSCAAPCLRILGIRGVPAAHGGFETFAEYLSRHLVRKGWRVIVYCQVDGEGPILEDVWEGIARVRIPVKAYGSWGTIIFDWRATVHAARSKEMCLTLGYNTAVFCALLRLKGIRNVINMDGIEWRRQKWGSVAKLWFWANDWAACWLGNHLVADNPEIKDHLLTRVGNKKISTIPYGADRLHSMPATSVLALGLQLGKYWTVIARPEPENSILEIVTAFSRKPRGAKLAVLGEYDPGRNAYHRAVIGAASREVIFLGAIYDAPTVKSLRFHAAGYIHGHQVGGTNPSLVEAMGAGNAVIAHRNKYNRWVAGETALYFNSVDECSRVLDDLVGNLEAIEQSRSGIIQRYENELTWDFVLEQYEILLSEQLKLV